jgi:transcriptional regulator EpsA
MLSLIKPELTEEHRAIFFEVIEASLRISQKSHLFNWLQHGFQYLIGHDVMVYGVRPIENKQYEFNYFSTTLDFSDAHFEMSLKRDSGVIQQAIKKWQDNNKPVFVSAELPSNEYPDYSVHNVTAHELQVSELKQFVVHGYGDSRSDVSSIVILGRMNAPINPLIAHFFELIMPPLHCALLKVYANRYAMQSFATQDAMIKTITKREVEVLEWLNTGKTNWEISEILGISPTTIKNHVQNIIRKLGVENRSQAAMKGVALGLISPHQFKHHK